MRIELSHAEMNCLNRTHVHLDIDTFFPAYVFGRIVCLQWHSESLRIEPTNHINVRVIKATFSNGSKLFYSVLKGYVRSEFEDAGAISCCSSENLTGSSNCELELCA